MKIAVGCDPNAKALKNVVIEELKSLGHQVKDFGSEDPIYANVVIEVGESVAKGDQDRGVVLCGTGIGASIAANKVPGVYCALVTDTYQAERAALSNNANMIALGQQVTGSVIAQHMVRTWIENTEKFDPEGRSAPKVKRISDYAGEHGS
ncbi:MAG: RpiB/LacA/LacB family sugar-phosphate isomerase [Spirochaetaceae bacterium]|nr:RpiB/LacA/LacB family sugar-phosphate isomerase [Spirochaetaceae bacterium]MDT8296780.1 RpiB/LacA/LacB family sugar-phosphate isomerase [Spirochaetaceae bacterium]